MGHAKADTPRPGRHARSGLPPSIAGGPHPLRLSATRLFRSYTQAMTVVTYPVDITVRQRLQNVYAGSRSIRRNSRRDDLACDRRRCSGSAVRYSDNARQMGGRPHCRYGWVGVGGTEALAGPKIVVNNAITDATTYAALLPGPAAFAAARTTPTVGPSAFQYFVSRLTERGPVRAAGLRPRAALRQPQSR